MKSLFVYPPDPSISSHAQAPEILTCPDKTLPHQNKEMEDVAYSTKVRQLIPLW